MQMNIFNSQPIVIARDVKYETVIEIETRSMMLPGMAAGWLQETIGYQHFFVWTIVCCLATYVVCAFLKIDPEFGKKKS